MDVDPRRAVRLAFAATLAACAQNPGVTTPPSVALIARAPATGTGFGTVFSLTTTGTERIVYRFAGGTDGADPYGRLLYLNGTLYGTTYAGGANNAGTVFALTPQGSETVLHSFGGPNDGANPEAGLTNVNGTLYGTTHAGGASGYGTVYSITTAGSETVLHSFPSSQRDGEGPTAPLLDVNGTLYGTTGTGAVKSGLGTLYKISLTGKEAIVVIFHENVALCCPDAGLIARGSTLYGAGAGGGAYGWGGGVFACGTSGSCSVLHSFSGNKGKQPDGWEPLSVLTDVNGTLYGTTFKGGTNKRGTVFAISKSGAEQDIYNFGDPDRGGPALPVSGVIDVHGMLYGTATAGGKHRAGAAYSLTRTGTFSVLHDFGGAGDGAHPQSDLINANGTLYGTTASGGS